MAGANVPQFGKWNNGNDVPYTVFFDKARKNKGGKMINPNDPQENPDMFMDPSPLTPSPTPQPKQRSKRDEPIGRGAIRPTPKHRVRRELDGDLGPNGISPARSTNESNYGRQGGSRTARSGRPSMGSEQSFEQSPLHYQAKATGRGRGSPAWEGQNRDSSHGTPARSKLRPAPGDESQDRDAHLPKFGDWNEGDNITIAFDKFRQERKTNNAPGNVSGTPQHPSSYGGRRNLPSDQRKGCCFPWLSR